MIFKFFFIRLIVCFTAQTYILAQRRSSTPDYQTLVAALADIWSHGEDSPFDLKVFVPQIADKYNFPEDTLAQIVTQLQLLHHAAIYDRTGQYWENEFHKSYNELVDALRRLFLVTNKTARLTLHYSYKGQDISGEERLALYLRDIADKELPGAVARLANIVFEISQDMTMIRPELVLNSKPRIKELYKRPGAPRHFVSFDSAFTVVYAIVQLWQVKGPLSKEQHQVFVEVCDILRPYLYQRTHDQGFGGRLEIALKSIAASDESNALVTLFDWLEDIEPKPTNYDQTISLIGKFSEELEKFYFYNRERLARYAREIVYMGCKATGNIRSVTGYEDPEDWLEVYLSRHGRGAVDNLLGYEGKMTSVKRYLKSIYNVLHKKQSLLA